MPIIQELRDSLGGLRRSLCGSKYGLNQSLVLIQIYRDCSLEERIDVEVLKALRGTWDLIRHKKTTNNFCAIPLYQMLPVELRVAQLESWQEKWKEAYKKDGQRHETIERNSSRVENLQKKMQKCEVQFFVRKEDLCKEEKTQEFWSIQCLVNQPLQNALWLLEARQWDRKPGKKLYAELNPQCYPLETIANWTQQFEHYLEKEISPCKPNELVDELKDKSLVVYLDRERPLTIDQDCFGNISKVEEKGYALKCKDGTLRSQVKLELDGGRYRGSDREYTWETLFTAWAYPLADSQHGQIFAVTRLKAEQETNNAAKSLLPRAAERMSNRIASSGGDSRLGANRNDAEGHPVQPPITRAPTPTSAHLSPPTAGTASHATTSPHNRNAVPHGTQPGRKKVSSSSGHKKNSSSGTGIPGAAGSSIREAKQTGGNAQRPLPATDPLPPVPTPGPPTLSVSGISEAVESGSADAERSAGGVGGHPKLQTLPAPPPASTGTRKRPTSSAGGSGAVPASSERMWQNFVPPPAETSEINLSSDSSPGVGNSGSRNKVEGNACGGKGGLPQGTLPPMPQQNEISFSSSGSLEVAGSSKKTGQSSVPPPVTASRGRELSGLSLSASRTSPTDSEGNRKKVELNASESKGQPAKVPIGELSPSLAIKSSAVAVNSTSTPVQSTGGPKRPPRARPLPVKERISELPPSSSGSSEVTGSTRKMEKIPIHPPPELPNSKLSPYSSSLAVRPREVGDGDGGGRVASKVVQITNELKGDPPQEITPPIKGPRSEPPSTSGPSADASSSEQTEQNAGPSSFFPVKASTSKPSFDSPSSASGYSGKDNSASSRQANNTTSTKGGAPQLVPEAPGHGHELSTSSQNRASGGSSQEGVLNGTTSPAAPVNTPTPTDTGIAQPRASLVSSGLHSKPPLPTKTGATTSSQPLKSSDSSQEGQRGPLSAVGLPNAQIERQPSPFTSLSPENMSSNTSIQTSAGRGASTTRQNQPTGGSPQQKLKRDAPESVGPSDVSKTAAAPKETSSVSKPVGQSVPDTLHTKTPGMSGTSTQATGGKEIPVASSTTVRGTVPMGPVTPRPPTDPSTSKLSAASANVIGATPQDEDKQKSSAVAQVQTINQKQPPARESWFAWGRRKAKEVADIVMGG